MSVIRAACCIGMLLLSPAAAAQIAAEPDVVETIDEPSAVEEPTNDDVTEVIGDVTEPIGETPAKASVTPSPSTPLNHESSSQAKVSGWARESLEFYPYDNGLRRSDPQDVTHVPRDRLLSRTQLLVRASYQKSRWFEAAISGAVALNVHMEGSGRDLGFQGWGSQGTSEVVDASLREAYLGFFGNKIDLRIGQQRVAWGVADVMSPNDVVNARDLRDPFLAEPEMLRVPTLLARATTYWGPASLELLFSPLFVPDRSSLYGRNWSAAQPDAPAEVRGLFALMTRAADRSIQDQVNDAIYQTRLPNRNGGGLSGGAKLSFHTAPIDLNFYYHYGYDGTPYLWINPALLSVLRSTDFAHSGFADLAPVLRAVDNGLNPLLAEYVRRHHAGFDVVTELGPFMVRIDAAFQSQRVFYRTDLTSISSPTALAVLSLDYQTGSVDKLLILEAVYVRLLETVRERLLAYEQNTYGLALVARWPLFWLLSVDVRAMLGIAPFFYVAQPALLVKANDFHIRLGALIQNGERDSLGWYYRHSASAYLQIRYSF